MKNPKLNRLIFSALPGLLLFTLLFTGSCNKDNNPGRQSQQANLMVINGLPGPQKFFVKVNGNNITPQSLAYSTSLPYTPVNSGNDNLSISNEGSAGVAVETTVQLNPARSFSAYIITAPENAGLVVMEDDFTAPAEGKAMIRFVNMSPDAGNLDLLVNGKPVPALANVKFKGFTSFVAFDPGAQVNFQIKESGSTDTLVSIPPVNVGPKKFYTLWAKGNKNSPAANAPVALGVINNK